MYARRQARPGDRRAQEIEKSTTEGCWPGAKKNNLARWIGEPGVGKTAIIEGLAQRMVAGEVPDLRDKRPVDLNINAYGGRRQISRRVRGARAEGAEGGDRAPWRADFVHRRGAHHRRCRPWRWRRRADVANVFKPMMARG